VSGGVSHGRTLTYRTWGDAGRPPLVLLHGFMGCAEDWATIAASLSERWCCIAPDLPGHGDTPFDPDQHGDFGRYAGSVVGLLDELGIELTAAVGYSMGGRLLLYLACTVPGRFGRIVVASASPGLDSAEERAERVEQDEQLARRLEKEAPVAFLEWWYHLPLFAGVAACAGYPAMLERRLQGNPQSHAAVLRIAGVGYQPSLWPALRRLKKSMLMVYGEQDTKYSALAERVTACGAHAAAVALPGCGHAAHVERPDLFTETCRAFFEE